MKSFCNFKAWLFTITTIVGAVAFYLIPKQPQADFDIIGILYLLQNFTSIVILISTFVSGILAVYFWSKVLTAKVENLH